MSISSPPARTRYDTFIIWGNGIEHIEGILHLIRQNQNFRILRIETHRVRNIKTFVKHVYRCDSVPLEHLTAKTQYLQGTGKRVVFVFVENLNVMESPVGEGPFRHLQCKNVVALKNEIRDRFNPRDGGHQTEEHVIHGTDNAQQTDYLLKLIGYPDGVSMFGRFRRGALRGLPYHLPAPHRVRFTRIPIKALRAGILDDDHGKSAPKLQFLSIEQTPHYRGLENIQMYAEYIAKYRFHYLLDDHCPENLVALGKMCSRDLLRLGRIAVERRTTTDYRVLDGLHRLAVMARRGIDSAPCVEFVWSP